MKFHSTDKIRLAIPKAALVAVFDECDGFDQDETGGRVIGTYRGAPRQTRNPGHRHNRSRAAGAPVELSVSFRMGNTRSRFSARSKTDHREIEHLGNWHTHHVNGLQHLSGGDIETYFHTVNHRNHNTPFFYALLVTAKHRSSDPLRRYTVKHYIFRRGDEQIYELRGRQVEIVDAPLVWPAGAGQHRNARGHHAQHDVGANPNRVYDKEILSEFYREVRPFSNAKLGIYWRGPLQLLDGSQVEVVLLEDSAAANPTYTVTLREPPAALKNLAEEIGNVEFPSARAALITTERSCNRALYLQHGGARRVDFSA